MKTNQAQFFFVPVKARQGKVKEPGLWLTKRVGGGGALGEEGRPENC